jgi:asparagine synthase (glutamine-hydrolysing)
MCGILGLIHRASCVRGPLSAKALASLAHRGPDGSGVFTDDHVQFGHTRLSIIDLSDAASQPMISQDGRYVVTFNGEIFNYRELKVELETLGQRFDTNSDTEVLLTAYGVWGRDCVKRFRGQFAFVIWDRQKKEALLGRDPCGEKPLFYQRTAEHLAFASEIKGLMPLLDFKPTLNVAAVDMYLHYQYVPEPHTLLTGVHKLAAGHTLLLTLDRWHAEPECYWSAEDVKDPKPYIKDTSRILTEIREGVEDAVKLTLRADVPIGIALSGGIDSGAIAVLAQKNYPEPMHAFCVGYPGRPKYDERQQAKSLAESLGMIVHEVELPVDEFVDFFPELVRIMDEPIADPAAFGHYSVPKAAADHGIKVLLSGIGGDEIFWGYDWVTRSVQLNQHLIKHPLFGQFANWLDSPMAQTFLYKLETNPHSPKLVRYWAAILRQVGDPHKATDQLLFYTLAYDFGEAFEVKQHVYGAGMAMIPVDNPYLPTVHGALGREQIPAAVIKMLFETWLVSNCLSLGDRVSMGVSVETRMPFLDVKLIELVMAWRANNPDHSLGQKAWLRAALKGVVPDEVLIRPKSGFQPPVREWLSGVVNRYVHVLRDGQLVKEGILARAKLDDICQRIPQQSWIGMYFTYKLILLEMWYQKVVSA